MSSKTSLLTSTQISAFCRQTAVVLNAGIAAYEGISILLEYADDDTKHILSPIFLSLDQGSSFTDALLKSNAFPSYMTHMVHLGEQTGKLEEVLDSLSEYYEREASIKEGIRHAVTYPILLTLLMLSVLFVLITKVLPVFQNIFLKLGSDLDGPARQIMVFSASLNKYLIIILLVLFLLGAVGFFYLRSKKGSLFLAGRPFFLEIARSRLSNVMALVLSSGFDTDEGLSLALEVIDNPILVQQLKKCQGAMMSGLSFADSICQTGIFTGIQQGMLTIGARTGSLDSALKKISQECEDSANCRIDSFLSTLEPAMLIVLSIVIGMIMLTFLLPLINIMSVLS